MTIPTTTESPPIDDRFYSELMGFAGKKKFRGGIVENCKRFRFVGDGYKAMPEEQQGQFWIESARQCAGPMASLTDDLVRKTHVIGATQVLKSMCGDAWVIYCVEHYRLPMLVLFEDDGKAQLFCANRLMDTLRHHPVISELIADAVSENRHQVKGTWIKISGTQVLVAGLNQGNVSTLSWPLIWISEAWQHRNDGLLFQAFKRADRYANTSKILNESQASVVDTDLHRATKSAFQVPLTWRCPACDGEQTWEWRHWNFKRPQDFKPLERKKISLATVGGQTIEIREPLPAPGTFGGMKWGTVKASNEDWSIEQKAASAYWECIWCGHRINDTREERKGLCETYEQRYKGSGPAAITPSEVCFTIPFESAWDNKFSKTVANYLVAKESKSMGNGIPMQDWFLAERAFFYDPNFRTEDRSISVGSYDPVEKIPNQHSVGMAVDCQQDQEHMDRNNESVTGWFWYIVRVYDKMGNSKQLARGHCKSWDEWIRIQRRWGVPNDRVVIDIDHWPTQIEQKAAECAERIALDPKPPFYKTHKELTWYLLAAENNPSQLYKGHLDNNLRPWSPEQPLKVFLYDAEQKRRAVTLKKVRFAKRTVSMQLDAIRSGVPGMPKFEVLDSKYLDEYTRNLERGNLTYQMQMDSQVYSPDKKKFEELRKDDHYRWCEEALLVRQAMDGLFGHVAVFEGKAE